MKTIQITMLLLLAFILSDCGRVERKSSEPETKDIFDVRFQPDLQNTIYPSAIFGLAEVEKQTDQAIDFFYIDYTAANAAEIRITIQESAINYETVLTKKMAAGKNTFSPKLKWKYEDLKKMAQPGYADITFVCTDDNGKETGRKDVKINYRSINECVLAARLDGKDYPLYYLMGSYINEDSPVVDAFLKEVLQTTGLNGFTGYQGQTPESVIEQVAAIFYTLRAKGVKYSSITDVSNKNPNVLSQYIRFADEVMNNTQANCADGTVFFCSILQKIGIHTAMIFAPGHVYLGYYVDRDKKQLYPMETTFVGTDKSFDEASFVNVDNLRQNIDKYENGDYFDMYFTIDVQTIRSIVKPIGR